VAILSQGNEHWKRRKCLLSNHNDVLIYQDVLLEFLKAQVRARLLLKNITSEESLDIKSIPLSVFETDEESCSQPFAAFWGETCRPILIIKSASTLLYQVLSAALCTDRLKMSLKCLNI